MLLGPVFNVELMTTARRARYYAIRFLYGSIILGQIYLSYEANTWRFSGQRQVRLNDLSEFAFELFVTFAIVQAVVVLLLTPALVGGTIADERQRKTLHYLLTSQLSSAEIVLGKLAARLLQVGVLVALGLPVVCLIGLFGGVDFYVLLLSYAGTITTIYFLATASMLVSVVSRRPREAITLIYILELVWLIVPPLVMGTMRYWGQGWPLIAEWVEPVLQYVAMTSPFSLLNPAVSLRPTALYEAIYWGMGLQVLYGTGFILLAALLLRPTARREGGTWRVTSWWAAISRKRRWFPRRPCGDDAMRWKELHVARTGGLVKAVFVLLGVALLVLIGYSGFGLLVTAMDEMSRDGYSAYGYGRRNLNGYLRGFSVGIYLLWFLGVASSSATSLCSEREEDQWISLTSTPLSGHEILRAKMIGPIWGFRRLVYLLFSLWAIGLMTGAIHPAGVILCLIELMVFTWFLTALGTFFSLRARNSTRALASTIALLMVLNGGYLFCFIPFSPNTRLILAGSTPVIFTVSLLGFTDFDGPDQGEMVATVGLCILLYGAAAASLTATLFSTFDHVIDRPDRLRQFRTPYQQQEYLKGRTKPDKLPDELTV
jgi:ABC-type transport system involved in multi-copper enzyme maturation permease subunit